MKYWPWFQLLIFDVFWFVCVAGQNDYLWLGLAILSLQFVLSPSKLRDLCLLTLALVGMAVDALLALVGLFAFDGFPFWLALLWFGFVVSLSHSLAWLNRLPFALLVLISSLSGGLSYFAGFKLGAVSLPFGPLVSFFCIAVIWSVLLPVLLVYTQKISQLISQRTGGTHEHSTIKLSN